MIRGRVIEMPDKIPNYIKDFVTEHIASVADLEGLLLLRKKPEIYWDSHLLAERLYIERQEADRVLKRLYSAGFLERDTQEQYCYKTQSETLSANVDVVAEIYTRSLVPLTNLIHSKPKSRIQEFADAFRLRKDT